MSRRSATYRPYVVWHRVDGSPGIIAALLHCIIESPYTIAYPLCVISRLASYCRRLAESMSCMHLMLPICHVWLSCMYLMRCLLHVPSEVMMSLISGPLGMCGHASEEGGPDQVSRLAEYFPFASDP
jgi:hypothetical protein